MTAAVSPIPLGGSVWSQELDSMILPLLFQLIHSMIVFVPSDLAELKAQH